VPLHILAIGKKHEDWAMPAIDRYQKRLKKPFDVEWILLPHSSYEGDKARQEESDRIQARLSGYDYVILLDERGNLLDSPALSALIQDKAVHSVRIAFVIGGAYGVTEQLRSSVQQVWSLSPLVFPHQLVRLILVEQIYRAQQISIGSPYHHQ
jgi:23S rRNA (pseudouridine1915-N3)-methyltransferase